MYNIMSVISVYCPQVGCTELEKDEFWEEVMTQMAKIPDEEILWIGGDLNSQIGKDNTGKDEVMGVYGYEGRNRVCTEQGDDSSYLFIMKCLYKKNLVFLG